MFRKIAAILLLAFLLFNWVGYRLFLSWYESREAARWESRLDNEQYDRGALVLFRVPATAVPYSNTSAEYERADGELEVGNIHYRYVLKRLYNDFVEFLCIPDGESGRLKMAKNEIIHLATDLPDGNEHGKSSPAGKIVPPLITVFYQQFPVFGICNFPAGEEKRGMGRVPALSAGHIRIGWQPPRAL